MAANFAEFIDPHPATGNQFGHAILPLSNGNVVITSPFDDAGGADAGAVYLFNGSSGQLISTLTGSSANDHVGLQGVKEVGSGNFVVISKSWDNGSAIDAGAVTFGNGITGVSGTVNSANSLVGTTADDEVGRGGVTVLVGDGNYVVATPFWDRGDGEQVGAFTFGNGASGITGTISQSNSLVGTDDMDGSANFEDIEFVIPLANGNYVVNMPAWGGNGLLSGAVTFGNGTTGISGPVSPSISLVGRRMNDAVGFGHGIVPLPNGNYVVFSNWQRVDERGNALGAGSVTLCNGTMGTAGEVNEENSLVGDATQDRVGSGGITILTNSNFVIASPLWNYGNVADVGAVTFFNGVTGVIGPVSAANSLVGTSTGDKVGGRDFETEGTVTALSNGNYVVVSQQWDRGGVANAGAVTFGNGATGISGAVSETNSLVGKATSDRVGSQGVSPLTHGNYVVGSPLWNNGTIADAGAATFGNGQTGTLGEIGAANSLIGQKTSDQISSAGIVALTNGNYVVASSLWDNGTAANAGAATFGIGGRGIVGNISSANSLTGVAGAKVGALGVTPLTNGNYVVRSNGLVTFGNGSTGSKGTANSTNSLVGNAVGGGGIVALKNGNYVVVSPDWDSTAALTDVGAVTFGSGTKGIVGTLGASNSLVGSQKDDQIGSGGISLLENGNYVVRSEKWHFGSLANAGALTFGNGNTGVTGTIDAANSARGQAQDTALMEVVDDDVNDTFFGRFLEEAGDIVRVGSQLDGFDISPNIGNVGADVSYTENAASIRLSPTATIVDPDSVNFAGGVLSVRFTAGATASDRLVVRSTGTAAEQINVLGTDVRSGLIPIGVLAGGVGSTPLSIRLNENATRARVQALLRSVAFQNTSDNPSTAARSVQISLSDGDGGASVPISQQITVQAVNDRPALSPANLDAINYTNNAAAIALFRGLKLSDPDSANFATGVLTVSITQGVDASNRLLVGGPFVVQGNRILLSGVTIGIKNINGGIGTTRLEIKLAPTATRPIMEKLIGSMRFRTIQGISTARRVIGVTVSDGDSGTSNSARKTVNL